MPKKPLAFSLDSVSGGAEMDSTVTLEQPVSTEFSTEQPSPSPEVQPRRTAAPYSPSDDRSRSDRFAGFRMRDGKPDIQAMSGKTREQLKSFLKDESLRKDLGMEPIKPRTVYTRADVIQLYSILGPIEGYLFATWLKVPAPVAVGVFNYIQIDPNTNQPQMKPECEGLVDATVAVFNKYAEYLEIWGDWKEEASLAMAFFFITKVKLEQLKVEVAKLSSQTPPNPALVVPPIEKKPNGSIEERVEDGFASMSVEDIKKAN